MTDTLDVARQLGRIADHPDDNPYEDNNEGQHLFDAWNEGWDEQWRARAITYYAGNYYGHFKEPPTVANVAGVFFITEEQVAAVCDSSFLYLSGHDELPLGEKSVEVDGE